MCDVSLLGVVKSLKKFQEKEIKAKIKIIYE
jgi:hypothetical protein